MHNSKSHCIVFLSRLNNGLKPRRFRCVHWLRPLFFAVVISVQLTHLMINVRHDCLLNRLILWPWPHQPLHSQCNPMPWFPSEKATKKNWSLCLPTVSAALPAARCYSSGCFDKAGCGETRGCKAGLCFHISTSGIKSAGCCNAHPERKKKKTDLLVKPLQVKPPAV